MNNQQMLELYAQKERMSQDYIADIYAGWGSALGASRIQLDFPTIMAPGESKEIKLRYSGQKATPTHVIPGCSCTPNWQIKAKEDEDLGKMYAFITTLTAPDLASVKARQEVINGAKRVAYSFEFEVNFKESENEKLLLSDENLAKYNPMSFSCKVQVSYIVDVTLPPVEKKEA